MAERLRVGILCDGIVFKHWEAECLRRVLAVSGVDPVVLVIEERAPEPHKKPDPTYALYRWFKRKRLRASALAPVDPSTDLAGIPRLVCTPAGTSVGKRFDPEDIAAIRAYRPDVLLRFGSDVLLGEILTLAPHGVWSYHHGDEAYYRGRPVAFWEIVHNDPVTGVTLQRLTENIDAGLILRKGWFPTLPHSWSANLDQVLLGATGWMAQVCSELVQGHVDAAKGVPSSTDAPLGRPPRNWEMLAFMSSHIGGDTQRKDPRRTVDHEWNVGVLYQPIASLLDDKPSLNVRWLPAPGQGQHRSGPSGYMADGQLNLLYAKFDLSKGKSVISRLRPKRDNVLKRSRTMLQEEHGVSSPFLFQHDGRSLVIPESTTGRVDLYEVDPANDGLRFVRTLIDEPLCAPTVFEHGGRWWLMGTKAPWPELALYAFHAPALDGPWTPHLRNPVKMDVRSARPAGTPFMHQGELYRPAQDNSQGPGWRVALMHVTELTPFTFHEELVRTIGPLKGSPWCHGTGTLSAVGDITLVDGRRPQPAPATAAGDRKRSRKKSTSRPSATHEEEEDDDED